MFKRANKTISLLVAAATIVTVVPSRVMAADKDTNSQKGEIYNVVAYKDGTFYIGGEPNKKDDAGYYLSNGKYNELDDINSDDKVKSYGTKYVEVKDGAYYIDLSNGKVTDDEVKDKDLDGVGVSLRSNIKYDNDGRYDDTDSKDIKTVTELPKVKFSDSWYKAEYKVKSASNDINGGATTFSVYTDKSGKYIDADYNLGKIKVKLGDGKSATLDNTNDENNSARGQVSNTTVIGQDSNNIYRLATITVRSTNGAAVSEVNGISVNSISTALKPSGDKTSVSFNVIQVISKSQASKEINGIKYAKNVTNYIISDKDGRDEALLSTDENSFTVADGKLINYKLDGNDLEAAVVNLKNKSSVYYIDLGDKDDVTVQDGESSVDTDINGNLWALTDENIMKFDNDGNFDEVYDTDKEYQDLSVYDEDNIAVWNIDDEVYSLISKNSNTSNQDTSNTNSGTNTNTGQTQLGWVLTSGSWSYNNSDGSKFKGWLKDGGLWYYLDSNGVMVTGWKYINGQWYFMNNSGAMQTGWLNDNGTWYYLNTSGEMLYNRIVNGYKLGPTGAWIK